MKENSPILAKILGRQSYPEAMALMEECRRSRAADSMPDCLLVLEHPAVITMGRRPSWDDLKDTRESLERQGIALVETDRGGKLTYHGPGQLVVYFIFNIAARKLSIEKFVWMAEEGLRLLLEARGLQGDRDPQNPGLWIGDRKIASLGFHVQKGITTHGIALNINADLNPFNLFVPCGLQGRGVTSLRELTGQEGNLWEMGKELCRLYGDIFSSTVCFEESSS